MIVKTCSHHACSAVSDLAFGLAETQCQDCTTLPDLIYVTLPTPTPSSPPSCPLPDPQPPSSVGTESHVLLSELCSLPHSAPDQSWCMLMPLWALTYCLFARLQVDSDFAPNCEAAAGMLSVSAFVPSTVSSNVFPACWSL